MLVKLGKEFDEKLTQISKASGIKKDEIILKVFDGFITRYEKKKGKIILPADKEKKPNDVWQMYEVFKKHHFINFGYEYEIEQKQQKIQLRSLKLTKEKILQLVMGQEKSQILAINEEDLLNSYEYLLVKMPDWWKINGFTPQTIYKNFEKILTQIKNGKQSGKDALDDFISGIGSR
jgi:hypothetical protein